MKVINYKDIEAAPVRMDGARGVTIRWLIARDDGAPGFAMRLFEIDPGGTTPLHKHAQEHEVFIIEGAGTVWRGDEAVPVTPGTAIFVPPQETHCFTNTGDGVMRFLCMVPLEEKTCG
ncbi:MAG: cupin domain-containing protein [Planctomycetes bacterium]|nr:cupin domain-containing protein [Planctomycetota bacterium]